MVDYIMGLVVCGWLRYEVGIGGTNITNGIYCIQFGYINMYYNCDVISFVVISLTEHIQIELTRGFLECDKDLQIRELASTVHKFEGCRLSAGNFFLSFVTKSKCMWCPCYHFDQLFLQRYVIYKYSTVFRFGVLSQHVML